MAFNINAQVVLNGPKNLTKVRSSIQKQLSNVSVPVKIDISKNAASQLGTFNQQLTALNSNLLKVDGSAKKATASISALGNAAAKINGVSGKLNNATKQVNKNLAQTQKQVKSTANEIESFGKDAALAIRRFSAFTIATGAIFGFVRAVQSATSEAIKFERELARIVQVTGATGRELQGLQKTVDDLAVGLGLDANRLLEVSRIFAQTGQSVDQVRKSLTAVARASLAPTFGDIEKTTEGVIAALNQFNLSADRAESVLGSLNAVSKSFAVEADDLISVIRRAGGVFAASSEQLGKPEERLRELLGIFTAVRSTTRETADTVATGLRTIFTRIQRPQTIKFLEQFGIQLRATADDAKRLGIAQGEFVGIFEAFRRISQEIDSLDTLSLAKVVEELGGIRQVGKLLPALREFEKAERARGVALEGTASISKDVGIATQTLQVQLEQLGQRFQKLFRDIAQSDTFQNLAKFAISAANAFITLADALRPALPLLTAIATVKLTGAAFDFARGFVGGIRKGGGAGGAGSGIAGIITGGGGGGGSAAAAAGQKQTQTAVTANTQAVSANTTALNTLNATAKTLTTTANNLVTQAKNVATTATNVVSALNKLPTTLRASLSGLGATSALRPRRAKGGTIPKFAKGGFVDGPSHANGGVVAELEGGEFVVPKDAVKMAAGGRVVLTLEPNKFGGLFLAPPDAKDPVSLNAIGQTVKNQSVQQTLIDKIKNQRLLTSRPQGSETAESRGFVDPLTPGLLEGEKAADASKRRKAFLDFLEKDPEFDTTQITGSSGKTSSTKANDFFASNQGEKKAALARYKKAVGSRKTSATPPVDIEKLISGVSIAAPAGQLQGFIASTRDLEFGLEDEFRRASQDGVQDIIQNVLNSPALGGVGTGRLKIPKEVVQKAVQPLFQNDADGLINSARAAIEGYVFEGVIGAIGQTEPQSSNSVFDFKNLASANIEGLTDLFGQDAARIGQLAAADAKRSLNRNARDSIIQKSANFLANDVGDIRNFVKAAPQGLAEGGMVDVAISKGEGLVNAAVSGNILPLLERARQGFGSALNELTSRNVPISEVQGIGTGTSDSIKTALEEGTYVLPADIMESLKARRPAFAAGGRVTPFGMGGSVKKRVPLKGGGLLGSLSGGQGASGILQTITSISLLGGVVSSLDFSSFSGLINGVIGAAIPLALLKQNAEEAAKATKKEAEEKKKSSTFKPPKPRTDEQIKKSENVAAKKEFKLGQAQTTLDKTRARESAKQEAVKTADKSVSKQQLALGKAEQRRIRADRNLAAARTNTENVIATTPDLFSPEGQKRLAEAQAREAAALARATSAREAEAQATERLSASFDRLEKETEDLADATKAREAAEKNVAGKEKAARDARRTARGTIAERRERGGRTREGRARRLAEINRRRAARGRAPLTRRGLSRVGLGRGLSGRLAGAARLGGLGKLAPSIAKLGTQLPKLGKSLAGGPAGIAAGVAALAAGPIIDAITTGFVGQKQELAGFSGFSKEQGGQKTAQTVGGIKGGVSGALGGAALGATLGSVVPVIGTGIGAILGAIAGGVGGAITGIFTSFKKQAKFEAVSELNDSAKKLSKAFEGLAGEGIKNAEALDNVSKNATNFTNQILKTSTSLQDIDNNSGKNFFGDNIFGQAVDGLTQFGQAISTGSTLFEKAAIGFDGLLASGFGGLATGAAIGAFFGPVGIAVGAGVGALFDALNPEVAANAQRRLKQRQGIANTVGKADSFRTSLSAIPEATFKEAQDNFNRLGDVIVESIPLDRLGGLAALGTDATFDDLTAALKTAGGESEIFRKQLEAYKSLKGVTIAKEAQALITAFDALAAGNKELSQTFAIAIASSQDFLSTFQQTGSIRQAGTAGGQEFVKNLNARLSAGAQRVGTNVSQILGGFDFKTDGTSFDKLREAAEGAALGNEKYESIIARVALATGQSSSALTTAIQRYAQFTDTVTKGEAAQIRAAARQKLLTDLLRSTSESIDALAAALEKLVSGTANAVNDFTTTLGNIEAEVARIQSTEQTVTANQRTNVFANGGAGRSLTELEGGVERVRAGLGGDAAAFADLPSTVQLGQALPQALKDTIDDIRRSGGEVNLETFQDELVKRIPNFDQLSEVVKTQLLNNIEAAFTGVGGRQSTLLGAESIEKALKEVGNLEQFSELSGAAAAALEEATNQLNTFNAAVLQAVNLQIQASRIRANAELDILKKREAAEQRFLKFEGSSTSELVRARRSLGKELTALLDQGGAGGRALALPGDVTDPAALLNRRSELEERRADLLARIGERTDVDPTNAAALANLEIPEIDALSRELADVTSALEGTKKSIDVLSNDTRILSAVEGKLTAIQESRLTGRQRATAALGQLANARTPEERARVVADLQRPLVAAVKASRGEALDIREFAAIAGGLDEGINGAVGELLRQANPGITDEALAKLIDQSRANVQQGVINNVAPNAVAPGLGFVGNFAQALFNPRGAAVTAAGETPEEKRLLTLKDQVLKLQEDLIKGTADQNAKAVADQQAILRGQLDATKSKLDETSEAFKRLRQEQEALIAVASERQSQLRAGDDATALQENRDAAGQAQRELDAVNQELENLGDTRRLERQAFVFKKQLKNVENFSKQLGSNEDNPFGEFTEWLRGGDWQAPAGSLLNDPDSILEAVGAGWGDNTNFNALSGAQVNAQKQLFADLARQITQDDTQASELSALINKRLTDIRAGTDRLASDSEAGQVFRSILDDTIIPFVQERATSTRQQLEQQNSPEQQQRRAELQQRRDTLTQARDQATEQLNNSQQAAVTSAIVSELLPALRLINEGRTRESLSDPQRAALRLFESTDRSQASRQTDINAILSGRGDAFNDVEFNTNTLTAAITDAGNRFQQQLRGTPAPPAGGGAPAAGGAAADTRPQTQPPAGGGGTPQQPPQRQQQQPPAGGGGAPQRPADAPAGGGGAGVTTPQQLVQQIAAAQRVQSIRDSGGPRSLPQQVDAGLITQAQADLVRAGGGVRDTLEKLEDPAVRAAVALGTFADRLTTTTGGLGIGPGGGPAGGGAGGPAAGGRPDPTATLLGASVLTPRQQQRQDRAAAFQRQREARRQQFEQQRAARREAFEAPRRQVREATQFQSLQSTVRRGQTIDARINAINAEQLNNPAGTLTAEQQAKLDTLKKQRTTLTNRQAALETTIGRAGVQNPQSAAGQALFGAVRQRTAQDQLQFLNRFEGPERQQVAQRLVQNNQNLTGRAGQQIQEIARTGTSQVETITRGLDQAVNNFGQVLANNTFVGQLTQAAQQLASLPQLQVAMEANVGTIDVVLNGASIISQYGEKMKGEILEAVAQQIRGLIPNSAGETGDPSLSSTPTR